MSAMDASAHCPCSSGAAFDTCCAPVLSGVEPAPTPERLMRSRYSAFVLRDASYLLETWHPGTRPTTLELDPDTEWLGLEILVIEGGEAVTKRGVVEFAASYRQRGVAGVHAQRERSRFVRQSDRWWHLDGEVDRD